MSMEGAEMWLCLAPNAEEIEVPDEPAVLEGKSKSERLRAVHFILWKQQVAKGAFVGTFEMFRDERMEKLISVEKSKIEE